MKKIDVVILWVDGNDKKWLEEKKKYSPVLSSKETDNNARYRDWGNLKYFFRGIEKNASWVNKVFFITWGHIPSWLNINNPKLKVVKHSDFIPKEYLPTYNSNVIELNLHRIKELSENFVLFNDDMFIINETRDSDFFINDLPCDSYCETINYSKKPNDAFSHCIFNNMCIVNKYFDKKSVYKKNFFKYFNFKYGLRDLFHSIVLLPYKNFSLIENKHLSPSLKKSTIEELWIKEYDVLDNCCKNRFRNYTDISQFLVRSIQLLKGDFVPRSNSFGKYFELTNTNEDIINELRNKKYEVVCLNDTTLVTDFDESKKTINSYLDEILPQKSKFEK